MIREDRPGKRNAEECEAGASTITMLESSLAIAPKNRSVLPP